MMQSEKQSDFEETKQCESEPEHNQKPNLEEQEHRSPQQRNYQSNRGTRGNRGGGRARMQPNSSNHYRAKGDGYVQHGRPERQNQGGAPTNGSEAEETQKVRTVTNKNMSSPQQAHQTRGGQGLRGSRGSRGFYPQSSRGGTRQGYSEQQSQHQSEESNRRSSKEDQRQPVQKTAHQSSKGFEPRATGPQSATQRPKESLHQKAYPQKFQKPYWNRPQHQEERYPAGGVYDEQGFYVYKDGSFVDPKGYFFNTDGYDEFGGYYDSKNRYVRPHPPYKHHDDEYFTRHQREPREQKEPREPREHKEGKETREPREPREQKEEHFAARQPDREHRPPKEDYQFSKPHNFPPREERGGRRGRGDRGSYRGGNGMQPREPREDGYQPGASRKEQDGGQANYNPSAHASSGAQLESDQNEPKIISRKNQLPEGEPEIISRGNRSRGGDYNGARGGMSRGGYSRGGAAQPPTNFKSEANGGVGSQSNNYDYRGGQKPWNNFPRGGELRGGKPGRGNFNQGPLNNRDVRVESEKQDVSQELQTKEPVIIERRGTRGRGGPQVQLGYRENNSFAGHYNQQPSYTGHANAEPQYQPGQFKESPDESESKFEGGNQYPAGDEQIKIDEDLAAQRLQKQQANKSYLKVIAQQQRLATREQQHEDRHFAQVAHQNSAGGQENGASSPHGNEGNFGGYGQPAQTLNMYMHLSQQPMFGQQMQRGFYGGGQHNAHNYSASNFFGSPEDDGFAGNDHFSRHGMEMAAGMEDMTRDGGNYFGQPGDGQDWDNHRQENDMQQHFYYGASDGDMASDMFQGNGMNLMATPFVPGQCDQEDPRDSDELDQYNNEAYQHVIQGYDPASQQFHDSQE